MVMNEQERRTFDDLGARLKKSDPHLAAVLSRPRPGPAPRARPRVPFGGRQRTVVAGQLALAAVLAGVLAIAVPLLGLGPLLAIAFVGPAALVAAVVLVCVDRARRTRRARAGRGANTGTEVRTLR